jgi:DNA-binding response OmpR family regulator
VKPREIVLVIDDSPATLGMLNETLERAGYTVLIAQSGPSAMDLVDRVTPDIVLLDAVMPGMDGFEVCRRLKRTAGLAAVPVIFMTGLTETEHVVMALEVGGVDYVTKPISPEEVLARIRVHITNARLTRSARVAGCRRTLSVGGGQHGPGELVHAPGGAVAGPRGQSRERPAAGKTSCLGGQVRCSGRHHTLAAEPAG